MKILCGNVGFPNPGEPRPPPFRRPCRYVDLRADGVEFHFARKPDLTVVVIVAVLVRFFAILPGKTTRVPSREGAQDLHSGQQPDAEERRGHHRAVETCVTGSNAQCVSPHCTHLLLQETHRSASRSRPRNLRKRKFGFNPDKIWHSRGLRAQVAFYRYFFDLHTHTYIYIL